MRTSLNYSKRVISSLGLISCYSLFYSPVGAETISAGLYHTCAVKVNNQISCWGDNGNGQINSPTGTFEQVDAGAYHNCTVDISGHATCWGTNSYGQTNVPAENFKNIGVGGNHSCGIKTDDNAVCWGANWYGQTNVPSAESFKQITGGWYHSCGIKTDGTLICWGENWSGKLNAPAGTFEQISAGWEHTCGIKTDGSLVCWGYNGDGQTDSPSGTFKAVSVGGYHSCGVKTDGTLLCWGYSGDGQTDVPAGESFSNVAAGGFHTCGVKTDSSVICWGYNGYGQATPPEGLQVKMEDPSSCGVATYSNDTRQAILPCLEMPLYLDPTGQNFDAILSSPPIGLYSATLEIPFGFSDFEVKALSFKASLSEPDATHAQFDPNTGVLTIPKIQMPSIVPWLNAGLQISGPKLECSVVLQQSILRAEVLSLTDLQCVLEQMK